MAFLGQLCVPYSPQLGPRSGKDHIFGAYTLAFLSLFAYMGFYYFVLRTYERKIVHKDHLIQPGQCVSNWIIV